MGKKTTMPHGKTWRLSGEILSPEALSDTEERQFSEIFSSFQNLTMAEPSLGVSAATMRGRETAARASLGYFCGRFADDYGRDAVIKAFATALALPVKPYDFNTLSFGAALWILDYVQEQDLQPELLPLLPQNAELPEFPAVDFRYPRDLVSSVAYVLLNRRKSTLKEFRKLTGLLRKPDAANLRAAFRDAILDYFGRFLEVCKRVAPATPPAPETAPTLSPFPLAKDLFSTGTKPPPPPDFRNLPERTPDVTFLIKTPSLIGMPLDKMQAELYYRRLTDLLSEFAVRNPYEICAASLLLERENDLLMNLNTLTNAVIACAERHLPWACERTEAAPPLYGAATPDYALHYTDGGTAPEGRFFSAQQLFYAATGYLLPRDREPSGELESWFTARGLSVDDSRALAVAAMALSAPDDARADAEGGVWEAVRANRKAPGEPGGPGDPDNAERVAELARQLKSAKQAAHEKEQLIRQLEEQLRDETRRAEQDRMELRGLRDTLFRTRAGEVSDFSTPEKPVQLPWQVRRRVLIFGGHDTWSKSIRPLLPGARFFERESLPDLNAIKGADVVWIQANALSHKFYYRIIETARRENILVRYFSFASARKCAEQVVENELSGTPES